MTQGICVQDKEAKTLGWTRWFSPVSGVKQGEGSHWACLPSVASSVWQVGVEDTMPTAAVSTAGQVWYRWLPSLPPPRGQHPAQGQAFSTALPDPLPPLPILWRDGRNKTEMKSLSWNLLPASCVTLGSTWLPNLCPYL